MLTLTGDLNDEPFEGVHQDDAPFNVPMLLQSATKLKDGEIPSDYGRDSFVFVFHPRTHFFYCFPGIEAENRENNATRVRRGVASFAGQGFDAYNLTR